MFRAVPLSIIRSSSLYTQQWYVRGLLTCEQTCMTYTIGKWYVVKHNCVTRGVFNDYILNNYIFRPVLPIFVLSQGNLRSYYKHARARGVEIYTYGPYQLSIIQTLNTPHVTQLCSTTYRFPSFTHTQTHKHTHTTGMTYFLDIYHCYVYSDELPMMDKGTVRNVQIFIPKINLRNQYIQLVLLQESINSSSVFKELAQFSLMAVRSTGTCRTCASNVYI